MEYEEIMTKTTRMSTQEIVELQSSHHESEEPDAINIRIAVQRHQQDWIMGIGVTTTNPRTGDIKGWAMKERFTENPLLNEVTATN